MKLTDNSPMPWGKYKGTEMANVPADYLLYVYDNDKCDADVREYVEDNMDVLLIEISTNKDIQDNLEANGVLNE